MAFPIKFSLREKDLLLNLISIEPEIVERLNHAVVENGFVSITVDIDDLDLLLGAIAADANHSESKKLEKELDSLFGRVDKIYQKQL